VLYVVQILEHRIVVIQQPSLECASLKKTSQALLLLMTLDLEVAEILVSQFIEGTTEKMGQFRRVKRTSTNTNVQSKECDTDT